MKGLPPKGNAALILVAEHNAAPVIQVCTPSHRPLLTIPEDLTVPARYTLIPENVVYLIKSFSCYKIDTLVKVVEEWMRDSELPGHYHFSSLCRTLGDTVVSVIRSTLRKQRS